MEVQLQEIIEKIKTDGVNSAEKQASEILQTAKNEADEILEKARLEAKRIVDAGKAEADRFEKASISSIEQASRNTLLAFKVGVTDALSELVKAETVKAYSADVLKTLIPETVKAFVKNDGEEDLAVLLSETDAKKLKSELLAAFKKQLSSEVEIKTSDDLVQGFRVGIKDGSAYYDFSAEAVAEMFSKYLNTRVAEILNSVVEE